MRYNRAIRLKFHFSAEMRSHMDKHQQDKTESRLSETKDKIWLPPSLSKAQSLERLEKKSLAEIIGFLRLPGA